MYSLMKRRDKGYSIQQDVDGSQVYHEVLMFKEIYPEVATTKKPITFMTKLVVHMMSCVPNLCTGLHIFLTLPVSAIIKNIRIPLQAKNG